MAEDLEFAPPTPPALGPGDPDGKPGIGEPETTRRALGPGDSERPKAASAGPALPPLGPGDSDGKNPEDGTYDLVTPPPAGPGGVASLPRRATRIPKRQPPLTAE